MLFGLVRHLGWSSRITSWCLYNGSGLQSKVFSSELFHCWRLYHVAGWGVIRIWIRPWWQLKFWKGPGWKKLCFWLARDKYGRRKHWDMGQLTRRCLVNSHWRRKYHPLCGSIVLGIIVGARVNWDTPPWVWSGHPSIVIGILILALRLYWRFFSCELPTKNYFGWILDMAAPPGPTGGGGIIQPLTVRGSGLTAALWRHPNCIG